LSIIIYKIIDFRYYGDIDSGLITIFFVHYSIAKISWNLFHEYNLDYTKYMKQIVSLMVRL